jgi:hypothetical protein
MRFVCILTMLLVSGLHSGPLHMEKLLTTEEVIEVLNKQQFTRDLWQWHIHHTWDPSYADFSWQNHHLLQEEMRVLHVEQNGWDDLGQHLTLFPDGTWMFGRDLNKDPASIKGWNRGAIAVEMVGNFDEGHDEISDDQWTAIVVMTRFMVSDLKLEVVFHREHPDSGKTCPGTSIDKEVLLSEVYELISDSD